MTAYTSPQYTFIVEQLAEGNDFDAIAFLFETRWKDTACVPDDVAVVFRDLELTGWKAYHDAHRAAFIANAPSAKLEFRVALLDKWAREAAARGARELAAKHLEQIAKEQGGAYAGKSVGGGAAPTVPGEPIAAITRTIIDPVVVE